MEIFLLLPSTGIAGISPPALTNESFPFSLYYFAWELGLELHAHHTSMGPLSGISTHLPRLHFPSNLLPFQLLPEELSV